MIVILTGAIGVGKTTVCERVVQRLSSLGLSCGGVISNKTRDGDIIVKDLQTGEAKLLASAKTAYRGASTARYSFNPEGIDFGVRAINRGTTADILIVDELGHLELRGLGFATVIDLVATGKVKNCLLVIRSQLLPAFLPKLGIAASVFQATLDNRERLPQEISLVLNPGIAV